MINPMDLTGKKIIVTGASSGIGKGIAIYLSRLGANLIILGRNEDTLKETKDVLESGKHEYFIVDLNNPGEIEGVMKKACHDGEKLNGIVYSAGISRTIPLQYVKQSDLQDIMTVNFFSFIEMAKHFSKRKYNDNGGSIVAISSISGKVGAKGLAAYCASKGAMDSAIRAMALDLASKNIRINSIAPGMIDTPIYEGLKDIVNNKDFETELFKRQVLGVGTPEDIAHAAAFLLSDSSRFVTGTSIAVDGGYSAH